MRAGELRHIVTFQEPTETAGQTGAPVITWTNVATCWAKISPVGGSETKNLESLQPDVSHTILVRYGGAITPTRITPKLRVWSNSRTFEIASVLNTDERNQQLVIAATERV